MKCGKGTTEKKTIKPVICSSTGLNYDPETCPHEITHYRGRAESTSGVGCTQCCTFVHEEPQSVKGRAALLAERPSRGTGSTAPNPHSPNRLMNEGEVNSVIKACDSSVRAHLRRTPADGTVDMRQLKNMAKGQIDHGDGPAPTGMMHAAIEVAWVPKADRHPKHSTIAPTQAKVYPKPKTTPTNDLPRPKSRPTSASTPASSRWQELAMY